MSESSDIRCLKNNKERPLVSVGVLHFNNEKFVSECLNSIISQEYKNIELIICNDCSTDNSEEIISNFIRANPNILIKAYHHKENLGIAKNSNFVLKKMSGEYQTIIGSDDLMLPNKISRQVSLLEKNLEAGICFSNMVWHFKILGIPVNFKHFNLFRPIPNDIQSLISDYTIPSPTILWRRESLNGILFRENLSQAADMIFTIEVALRTKFIYLNECLVKYRRHKNNSSSNRNFYSERRRVKNILSEIFMDNTDYNIYVYNYLISYSKLNQDISHNNLSGASKSLLKLFPRFFTSYKWFLRLILILINFSIAFFRKFKI